MCELANQHTSGEYSQVFSSGQAIREASLTVLRPTLHGSEMSRTQKHNQGLSQTWTA